MVPGQTSRCEITVRPWPMRHARSRAWSSTAGFHQRSYSTTWLAAVRLSPVPPAFSDSTRAPGPVAVLEVGDQAVAGAAAEAAVVAGDRDAGDLGEVVGQAAAPRGEVGEDQDPLAGGEDRLDDLLEAGQLPGASGERLPVVAVGRRVVADLLERGDRGQDRALLAFAERSPDRPRRATSSSSTAW